MGDVYRIPDQRREFIVDGARSQLRATWHLESGLVVVSLWRGENCVATSHLTPTEAGRLSTFITSGLGDLATDGQVREQRRYHQAGIRHSWPTLLSSILRQWRKGTARLLESVAGRIGDQKDASFDGSRRDRVMGAGCLLV